MDYPKAQLSTVNNSRYTVDLILSTLIVKAYTNHKGGECKIPGNWMVENESKVLIDMF